jgi:hypothetical protein
MPVLRALFGTLESECLWPGVQDTRQGGRECDRGAVEST